MINGKNFSHLPISSLMAIVKHDLRKLDDEGLIDEASVIKTVMACNDRLGLHVREVKEVILPVIDYKAQLPVNFEKLYFTCALKTGKKFKTEIVNPFDNKVDRDVIYDAKLDRASLGGIDHYQVVIKKITNVEVSEYREWTELQVVPTSLNLCHNGCPNLKKTSSKKVVLRDDGIIECPFEEGELYVMFLANMMDEEGNILFPFHSLITPWYEWSVKEKIIRDAIYNSDGNYMELLKDAKMERGLAWLDAFRISTERSYMEEIKKRKEQELRWYKQYFQHIK